MSQRETKLLSIFLTGNKGMFKSYDEIKKFADALKAKFEYIKNTNSDYYINAFIGMSDFNIRHGNHEYADNKKPGKNKLVKVPKKHRDAEHRMKEPWHIHLLIEANPGETVGVIITKYLNKKIKRGFALRVKVDRGHFKYAMKQCEKMRFVEEHRKTNLVRYNFKHIYEDSIQPLSKAAKKRNKKIISKCLEKPKRQNAGTPL